MNEFESLIDKSIWKSEVNDFFLRKANYTKVDNSEYGFEVYSKQGRTYYFEPNKHGLELVLIINKEMEIDWESVSG